MAAVGSNIRAIHTHLYHGHACEPRSTGGPQLEPTRCYCPSPHTQSSPISPATTRGPASPARSLGRAWHCRRPGHAMSLAHNTSPPPPPPDSHRPHPTPTPAPTLQQIVEPLPPCTPSNTKTSSSCCSLGQRDSMRAGPLHPTQRARIGASHSRVDPPPPPPMSPLGGDSIERSIREKLGPVFGHIPLGSGSPPPVRPALEGEGGGGGAHACKLAVGEQEAAVTKPLQPQLDLEGCGRAYLPVTVGGGGGVLPSPLPFSSSTALPPLSLTSKRAWPTPVAARLPAVLRSGSPRSASFSSGPWPPATPGSRTPCSTSPTPTCCWATRRRTARR